MKTTKKKVILKSSIKKIGGTRNTEPIADILTKYPNIFTGYINFDNNTEDIKLTRELLLGPNGVHACFKEYKKIYYMG